MWVVGVREPQHRWQTSSDWAPHLCQSAVSRTRSLSLLGSQFPGVYISPCPGRVKVARRLRYRSDWGPAWTRQLLDTRKSWGQSGEKMG